MGTKLLKPVSPEIVVRDPITKVPLAITGELKPWVGTVGSYWRRRVLDGSVIVVEPAKPAKAEEEKSSGDASVQFSKKERGK